MKELFNFLRNRYLRIKYLLQFVKLKYNDKKNKFKYYGYSFRYSKIIKNIFAGILISILFIIAIINSYIFIPFSNIDKTKDINYLISHHITKNDIKNLNIKVFKESNAFHNLFIKYYPGFNGSSGFYLKMLNILVIVDEDISNNNFNDLRKSFFFHEYLHHVFFEELKHEKISKIDLYNVMMFIINNGNKYDKEMLLVQTELTNKENNIMYGLTEYISHKYEVYFNGCQDKKDIITEELIRYNLLPQSIYCYNNHK